jgi:uncharacterized protein (DUF983 family)
VTENGILAYDLAGSGIWCEECGTPKLNRLLMSRSDCKTCQEAITRHRCTGLPDLDGLPQGAAWSCPDCGTAYVLGSVEDTCGECGQVTGYRPAWGVVFIGTRVDTAPRYTPQPWTPMRNLISRPRSAQLPLGSCYRMRNGSMVHVKPGCRCPR